MKTVIISDVHGCSGALRTLLAKIFPDPKEDRLIMLGDLFDRGPDSWGVFRMVKELADAYGDRFVLLRGNHEDYLMQPKLTFQQRLVWERVGRGATARSFKQHGEKMEDTLPWLKDHVMFYYRGESGGPSSSEGGDDGEAADSADGDASGDAGDGAKKAASGASSSAVRTFQCVHAGLMIDPIEANDYYTMIHDHYVVEKNRYRGPLTIVGHIALEKPAWFAGDGKTVVKLEEEKWYDLPEKGIICIDAGCGKGGRLVGMVIEGGKYMLHGVSDL